MFGFLRRRDPSSLDEAHRASQDAEDHLHFIEEQAAQVHDLARALRRSNERNHYAERIAWAYQSGRR